MIDFRIGHNRAGYTVYLGDVYGGYFVAEGLRTKKDAIRVRALWRKKWRQNTERIYGMKHRAEILTKIVEVCR